jgi:hypothetical protein
MRLVVSEPAADLIQERGGRLYVWVRRGRCCGGLQTLETSSEARAGVDFRRIAGDDRLELFVPARLSPLPDELHVDVRRYPRRIEAYWNGCAWVT